MLHFSRWKTALILFICLLGIVATIPNFFSRETVAQWPSWVPSRQLTLGLDLQGGSHILLGVDTDAVIKERLNSAPR